MGVGWVGEAPSVRAVKGPPNPDYGPESLNDPPFASFVAQNADDSDEQLGIEDSQLSQ